MLEQHILLDHKIAEWATGSLRDSVRKKLLKSLNDFGNIELCELMYMYWIAGCSSG